jgi:Trk-type K+ transport system membrane component
MWIGRLEIIPVLVLFATLYFKTHRILKNKWWNLILIF